MWNTRRRPRVGGEPSPTSPARARRRQRSAQASAAAVAFAAAFAFAAVASVTADASADDAVALRMADGVFLHLTDDGWLRPGPHLPGARERFDLLALGDNRIALRGPAGRFFTPVAPDGRWLHLEAAGVELADRHMLLVRPVDGNRVAVRSLVAPALVHFDLRVKPAGGPAPPTPRAFETVEIYRSADAPAMLQALFTTAMETVVQEMLAGQRYDKTRVKKIDRYAEVWSPALNNLGHKKRQRVLATEERQRIEAEVEGKPDFHIAGLTYLRGWQRPDFGLLLFDVRAEVPLRGSVQYQIPNLVSATAKFLATAKLSVVGEIRIHREGDAVTMESPEVRQLAVDLDLRHFSNDLLDAAREPIEDVVNREIRDNDARIRSEANRALKKAIERQQFHSPLVRYLLLP